VAPGRRDSLRQKFIAGPEGERFANWGIWILIAYTAARNVWAASVRPFWYDELCTVAVARAASFSALLGAFRGAKDSNPLPFYLIEYVSRTLSTNQHVSYRLPSIAGFCLALWCLFAVIRKRNGAVCALVCSATLLLTPLYHPYAVEARPYSMVAACIAMALFCYQRTPRPLWTVLFGLSLAASESLHFYALFAFVPFAMAESALLWKERRFRWGVWLAMGFGLVPLVLSWTVLKGFQEFYGARFWASASLVRTASTYALFLKTFAPIAIAIVAVLAIISLWGSLWGGEDDAGDASWQERWLAVGLLALPVVGYAATKVAHGGLAERYVLPMVLGLPLGFAWMLGQFERKTVALFAGFVLIAVTLQEGFFWKAERGTFGKVVSPADAVERLVDSAPSRPDLPIVVSDGHDYVPLAYYASPDWAKRFVSVVDPEEAVVYSGSDSLDKQLSALQCCLPLRVYGFHNFADAHPAFLLYSGGGDWDWWPVRLLHDGYTLQLLAAEKNNRLYSVSHP
jgi:hypothetical protein